MNFHEEPVSPSFSFPYCMYLHIDLILVVCKTFVACGSGNNLLLNEVLCGSVVEENLKVLWFDSSQELINFSFWDASYKTENIFLFDLFSYKKGLLRNIQQQHLQMLGFYKRSFTDFASQIEIFIVFLFCLFGYPRGKFPLDRYNKRGYDIHSAGILCVGNAFNASRTVNCLITPWFFMSCFSASLSSTLVFLCEQLHTSRATHENSVLWREISFSFSFGS